MLVFDLITLVWHTVLCVMSPHRSGWNERLRAGTQILAVPLRLFSCFAIVTSLPTFLFGTYTPQGAAKLSWLVWKGVGNGSCRSWGFLVNG